MAVKVKSYHACEEGTARRDVLDRFLMQNRCIISFWFTPKLSGLVVITDEIDFNVDLLVIAEVKCMTQIKNETEICKCCYRNICRFSSCR